MFYITLLFLIVTVFVPNEQHHLSCKQPLIVFTEWHESENNLNCITENGVQTLVSGEGLGSIKPSPHGNYIAYTLQLGGYRTEHVRLMIFDLSTGQSEVIRDGDGHIVMFWTEDNTLLIQSYVEFPRPVSMVYSPSYFFEFDPTTGTLNLLPNPKGFYLGETLVNNQYAFFRLSCDIFFMNTLGETTPIHLPHDVCNIGQIIWIEGENKLLYYHKDWLDNSSSEELFLHDLDTTDLVQLNFEISHSEYTYINRLELSYSNQFLAITYSDGRNIIIYDLFSEEIIFDGYVGTLEGFLWLNNDALIMNLLNDPDDRESGSNLYSFDPVIGNLHPLTNTPTGKSIP